MNTSELITNLQKWEPMIEQGLCLVPTKNEGVPVEKWSLYVRPYSIVELYDVIDRKNATDLEIVLGKRSDGLICIDVDTKYKLGFDASLFEFLKVYGFWDTLVIDRSPSGGYHIYFKVDWGTDDTGNARQGVGNLKVCRRPSTTEELSLNPSEKTKCFLEIKGEGGLSRCWPSARYERIQGEKYPRLSFSEFMSVKTLCESFNEDIIEIKPPKAPRSQEDWYVTGENPFDSYNLSYQGGLLEEQGWILQTTTGGYKRYSKPGRKNKDIDVTYNIAKRFYRVHAANCGIECGVYSPVAMLCYFKFPSKSGKSECYAWLVKNGFGRLKPERESRLVKKCVESNIPLPSNISSEAKKEFEVLLENQKSEYPYGIFWDTNDMTGAISINRERLYSVSGELGFRLYKNEVCIINGHIIEITNERTYYDALKQYIGDNDTEEVKNEFESFIQKSGKFTISRIPILDEGLILNSTKYKSYKGYRNGYLVITEDEIALEGYHTLDKLIWKHSIQDREFEFFEHEDLSVKIKNSLAYKFLDKAIQGGLNEHTYRCIGYYAHDFKSTTTSYIVILCENCENPKKGGGAGKNIFTNLLGWTTGLLNKPGKNVKFDDTLLRTWNPTKRILSLNDLDKKFDFLGLKELASGEGEVGKKFVQEITVSNKEMPKFICNTNFSFDPSQPGLKRRLIGLEFTSFFIERGGVDVYFGKDFPSDKDAEHDWTKDDWIGFDWIIASAIQKFIKGNCKLLIPELSDGGWSKQFEQRFGQLTHLFIKEHIVSWLERKEVIIEDVFGNKAHSTYSKFCEENSVDRAYKLSSIKMNEALEEYCSHHKIYFERNKNSKYNGIQVNVKVFKKYDEDEENEIEDSSINEFNFFNNADVIKGNKTTDDLPF